jgi:hypothetical protein
LVEDFVRIRTTLTSLFLSLTKKRYLPLPSPYKNPILFPPTTLLYFKPLPSPVSLHSLSQLQTKNLSPSYNILSNQTHSQMAIENQDNTTTVREIKPKNRRIMVCTLDS